MEFESSQGYFTDKPHLTVNFSNLLVTPNPDLMVNNNTEKGKMQAEQDF